MYKEYISANYYCRKIFGCKVYKLALSAATSCPNRDGSKGINGCAFCSAGGSGDFAAPYNLPVDKQIEYAKKIVGKKASKCGYLAYFQSFTGTYGDLGYLEKMYNDAVNNPDILGLSIATRPDCLGKQELNMLKKLSEKKPLWVELGLQTINENTAERINRCYPLETYNKAVNDLRQFNVHIITHVILGLPLETHDDMLKTVDYVGKVTDGIKLQLLHVLEGTPLAKSYLNGEFRVLEQEEYYNIVADALEILPESVVIHRLTGDGAKKDLIAPLWSADKKRVMNDISKKLRERNIIPKLFK